MRKPTPQEREQLRAAYPEGQPRIDYREMAVRAEKQADGAITVAISSETPVRRYDWWRDEEYFEVLGHSPSEVDLSYSRDGLPFVASHRAYDADQQHGIVENVRLEKDRVLRGEIRMSRAPRSQEIGQDIEDGIRKKVSVGYVVGDYEETKTKKDEIPTRRYNWMPIEVSTVPIPADYSVGIGRAQSADGQAALHRYMELHQPPSAAPKAKERTMPEDNTAGQNGAANTSSGNATGASARALSPEAQAAITAVRDRSRQEEAGRVEKIVQLGNQHGVNDHVERWLSEGTPVSAVVEEINGILDGRLKDKRPIQQARPIGLNARDHKRFSYARVMLMQDGKLEREFSMDPEHGGGPSKLDFGLEREVLTEAQQRSPIPVGARKGGIFVPFVTQQDGRELTMGERLSELRDREMYYIGRGIDSATTTTGGPFKFAQPGDFIALLRNKSSVLRAGVTVLSGLAGPVTFPKQSGPGSASWRAENPGSDISRVDLATTTVTLAFKTIQAAMAVSRQALFSAASGNFDLEGIIRSDLAAIIGLAVDLAGLNGLGSSNQPLGLLQDTSVGTAPALGTNGGSISWGAVVDLETAIGDANADVGTMSYLTNTKQRGQAKKVAVLGNTAAGVPIWTGTPGIMDGVVNGYRAIASNQVPRNLTKGTATTVCSAWVFGVFEHLLMGVFGSGFEMLADPYTLKLQNMVDLTAWSFVDFANRYPVAFATLKDAL